jgi:hypothetical protein
MAYFVEKLAFIFGLLLRPRRRLKKPSLLTPLSNFSALVELKKAVLRHCFFYWPARGTIHTSL